MMKLYGYRNGRTLRALWTLEEVGAPYEYVEVDILRGEGRSIVDRDQSGGKGSRAG